MAASEKEKIALGETLPMRVVAVEEAGPSRYRTFMLDDEGNESVIYLDVKLPLGDVEVRVQHLMGGRDRDYQYS
ncbi:MAG: hypothetical protein QCI38_00480 [Candidatus Thermoplasmatota archaeon]|nr:hypothetical protein [Candidatus Thermoplasmatota archaeon]